MEFVRRAIHYFANCSSFKFALLVGVLGGIVNVFVDIDHAPVLWGGDASRAFHPAFLIGGGIIFICYLACLGGSIIELVLEKRRKEKDV